jgi:hypothetical protein
MFVDFGEVNDLCPSKSLAYCPKCSEGVGGLTVCLDELSCI